MQTNISEKYYLPYKIVPSNDASLILQRNSKYALFVSFIGLLSIGLIVFTLNIQNSSWQIFVFVLGMLSLFLLLNIWTLGHNPECIQVRHELVVFSYRKWYGNITDITFHRENIAGFRSHLGSTRSGYIALVRLCFKSGKWETIRLQSRWFNRDEVHDIAESVAKRLSVQMDIPFMQDEATSS